MRGKGAPSTVSTYNLKETLRLDMHYLFQNNCYSCNTIVLKQVVIVNERNMTYQWLMHII